MCVYMLYLIFIDWRMQLIRSTGRKLVDIFCNKSLKIHGVMSRVSKVICSCSFASNLVHHLV